MDENNYNGAKDSSDERDIKYGEIAGGDISSPSFYMIDNKHFQNQNIDGYFMGCVFYSTAEVTNELNNIEGSCIITKGSYLCDKAKLLGKRSPIEGAYIVDGPKVALLEGLIEGYTLCETLNDIKLSIYNNKPVHTGSLNILWNKITEENGYKAVWGSGYAHSFHIVGYDDINNILICKNSYGCTWGNGGYFYINYSDVSMLFISKYNFIDKKNDILVYKNKIMSNIKLDGAKKAFENNFWNGLNPQATATREEVAAMVERMYEKLKNNQ